MRVRSYARVGIGECWIVDLTAERVEAHRNPGAGTYASISRHDRDAVLHPLALSDLEVRVDEVLPPAVASDEPG